MSESATCELNATNIMRLLELFIAYLNSNDVVVQADDSAPLSGMPVHLDGEAFLDGFVRLINTQNEDPEFILDLLIRVLDLCTYLRAGGVKTCLYRLETGCSTQAPDFFDTLSQQLRFKYHNGRLEKIEEAATSSTLLQKLRSIKPEDEDAVRTYLPEIDGSLLQVVQILDANSMKDPEKAPENYVD